LKTSNTDTTDFENLVRNPTTLRKERGAFSFELADFAIEFLEPFDGALAMSRGEFAEVSFRFFPRLSRLRNCLLCQPGGFFFCSFGGFRCLSL
jgi:hypothetical protein